ncbi:glycosyltransferase family 10 domain-containing protein [Anabaena sp. PCC 7108]|uniref:glycosyltransferase family 10 domain-containing protein n=1 Tax=Anabaena sp. PCC 7108 TaxID=163908 RepID=UPI000348DC00|nr:glycosyltransferase family 10 [Anabaena sp. PCC 7108]
MKFCEKNPDGVGALKQLLSGKDIHGNSGLSYLESQGYYYTSNPQEADWFISMNGQFLPNFSLRRTILIITEPYSRYKKMYGTKYKKLFGGFLGISSSSTGSDDEFYLGPQDFSSIQEFQEQPEHTLAMVHQRYKKECRNLQGDIEREKAVNFFDNAFGDDFHTYGRVWNKTLPWNNRGWKGVLKGSIMGNDKLVKLRNYKFLICFENSREDGYITEKIFSAFFAGAIPIYFGAPDIATHIPQECYLEFDGSDYDELYKRMMSITPSEFNHIRDNIKTFLSSTDGAKFTSVALAKKLEFHFHRLENVPNSPYSPQEFWRKSRFILLKKFDI